ncbi:MAG: hypothetical protein AAFN30_06185 [Actinomycetota bacterium]
MTGQIPIIQPKRPDPIDALLDTDLRPGRIAFNPPTSMSLGQHEQFSVRITRSRDLDQLLTDGLGRPGAALLQSVRSSYRMRVQARATDGLDLRALSEETQIVGTTSFSEWQFVVGARQGGKEVIWVSVSALLGNGGDATDSVISLPVLHQQVVVNVGAMQRSTHFVAAHWKWMIGTALAFSGAVVAWIRVLAT